MSTPGRRIGVVVVGRWPKVVITSAVDGIDGEIVGHIASAATATSQSIRAFVRDRGAGLVIARGPVALHAALQGMELGVPSFLGHNVLDLADAQVLVEAGRNAGTPFACFAPLSEQVRPMTDLFVPRKLNRPDLLTLTGFCAPWAQEWEVRTVLSSLVQVTGTLLDVEQFIHGPVSARRRPRGSAASTWCRTRRRDVEVRYRVAWADDESAGTIVTARAPGGTAAITVPRDWTRLSTMRQGVTGQRSEPVDVPAAADIFRAKLEAFVTTSGIVGAASPFDVEAVARAVHAIYATGHFTAPQARPSLREGPGGAR